TVVPGRGSKEETFEAKAILLCPSTPVTEICWFCRHPAKDNYNDPESVPVPIKLIAEIWSVDLIILQYAK
ncbi:hypothetical protein AVEN_183581-1, partial [Araneus ventricosus]